MWEDMYPRMKLEISDAVRVCRSRFFWMTACAVIIYLAGVDGGSALSSHAVYQTAASIEPARDSSAAIKSVPLARGLSGWNSPVFSSSYSGTTSLTVCDRYCLMESQTFASLCGARTLRLTLLALMAAST